MLTGVVVPHFTGTGMERQYHHHDNYYSLSG